MTSRANGAIGTEDSHGPRRRERRTAFADLLTALARGLDRRGDVSLLRGAFEEMLRRVVPARTVHLRDAAGRSVRSDAPGAVESIALEVPGPDPVSRGVLEATFDPGCRLGDWDFQMLGLAANLGSLVLEIERGRLQLARAGLLQAARPRQEEGQPIVGSTPAIHALRSTIERVAATDFIVLLEGESGVGKELVARQIHESSRRRQGPFVAVNCAALVETLLEAELFGIEERTATGVRGRRGKFEHADGGTLFLDEVSDLSPSAQAKLLRALQDCAIERVGGHGAHRVDTRIVAATNRSLSEMVGRGLFRLDLFYRLSGVDIRVPALRERREDILELALYFLDRHRETSALRLSPRASEALVSYDWPGNVRELERLIERAIALTPGDTVDLDDLPPRVRGDHEAILTPSLARDDSMRAWGSRYARLMLERCRGNKRQACRVLDISYHTLQAYLRYGRDGVRVAPQGEDGEPVAGAGSAGEDLGVEAGDAACVAVGES